MCCVGVCTAFGWFDLMGNFIETNIKSSRSNTCVFPFEMIFMSQNSTKRMLKLTNNRKNAILHERTWNIYTNRWSRRKRRFACTLSIAFRLLFNYNFITNTVDSALARFATQVVCKKSRWGKLLLISSQCENERWNYPQDVGVIFYFPHKNSTFSHTFWAEIFICLRKQSKLH